MLFSLQVISSSLFRFSKVKNNERKGGKIIFLIFPLIIASWMDINLIKSLDLAPKATKNVSLHPHPYQIATKRKSPVGPFFAHVASGAFSC